MPLRNFGLSFSRRSARANAGVTWPPTRLGFGEVGLALIVILILLAWLLG